MSRTPGLPRPEQLAAFADVVLDLAHQLDITHPDLRGVVPLTGTEIAVIREVHRTPRSTPSQIAEVTGLQRSNVSTTIRTLEAKGLVVREQSTENARSIALVPTALAAESIARIHAWWEAKLGVADPEALADALQGLDALSRLASSFRRH